MCASAHDQGNRRAPRTHPCQIADAVQRPAQSTRDPRPAVRREEWLAYIEMGKGMYVNVAYQIAVFPFWISQLCELWILVARFTLGNIQRCMPRWSGPVSSGTSNFVLDPTTVTPALSSSSAQFDFHILNAKSRGERNLELRLCELLLGKQAVLSGHEFFFSNLLTRRDRERERERERERVDRTYRWRKFRFQWLSQWSEEEQERLDVLVRWAWKGKAHHSLSTTVSSVLRGVSLPSIFSQSAEGPHEQRRMASRKEQLFALFFVAWIKHLSHGKFFMGFRRAKFTQRNKNCQKNIFADDQVPGHQPRA